MITACNSYNSKALDCAMLLSQKHSVTFSVVFRARKSFKAINYNYVNAT